jgi:RNA polymerase sigma-70 factor (ECF subfamily)
MTTNDNQLIKSVQDGDMRAFEQLIHKYDRQVLNIAASFRNNEDDAKDIYQEVFLRVYKGLKNFQFRSEFSTWLYRITTNVCISFQRKEKKYAHESIHKEIREDEESSTTLADMIPSNGTTDSQVVGSDLSKHINKALNKLPPQQKMAFTLKHYQGLKIKEIAKMMNCKDGTVKRYLFTATNKMREQLGNILEK